MNNLEKIERILEKQSEADKTKCLKLLESYSDQQLLESDDIFDEMSMEGIDTNLYESVDFKEGLIFEYNTIEDILPITKGKFKPELALFFNDGGKIEIHIGKHNTQNRNRFDVHPQVVGGNSSLAKEASILEAIKEEMENGDLKMFESSDTISDIEKTSLQEILPRFSDEDLTNILESKIPVEEKQMFVETIQACIEGDAKWLSENSKNTESVIKYLQETFEPSLDDGDIEEKISPEKLSECVQERGLIIKKQSKNVFNIKDGNVSVGQYNRLFESFVGKEKIGLISTKEMGSKIFENRLKEAKEMGSKIFKKRLRESKSLSLNKYADVVVKKGDKTLFLERSVDSDIEPNKIGLAGGKIEDGESPEMAAVRELKEETGINKEQEDLKKIKTINNDDGSTSHYFEVEISEDEEIALDPEEHVSYEFLSESDIKTMDNMMFGQNDRFLDVCYGDRLSEDSQKISKDDVVSIVEEWNSGLVSPNNLLDNLLDLRDGGGDEKEMVRNLLGSHIEDVWDEREEIPQISTDMANIEVIVNILKQD